MLVHPQTGDGLKEHTEVRSLGGHGLIDDTDAKQLATWIGPELHLNLGVFDEMAQVFSKLTLFKRQQEGNKDDDMLLG